MPNHKKTSTFVTKQFIKMINKNNMAKSRNGKTSPSKEEMLKVKTNEDFNKQIPNSKDPNQTKAARGKADVKARN